MGHTSHMNHSSMNHSGMDHMDHSVMDHMDHSDMSPSDHGGHDMTIAAINTTTKAIMDAVHTGLKMVDSDDDIDHIGQLGHGGHMGHGGHHMIKSTDDQMTTDMEMDHGMSVCVIKRNFSASVHYYYSSIAYHRKLFQVVPYHFAFYEFRMFFVQADDDIDHIGQLGHGGHMGHGGHHMIKSTDDQMTTDMEMDHGMSMSFHFGYNETILFDWWNINTIGGLIGSMIGIFILAMLYEGLKYWREHLFRKAIAAVQYCANVKGNITDENKASQFMEQIIMPPTMNMLSKDHGIQTLLHMIQMIVSYLLMLIFMTYNVWLCLAVVFGAGLGYFLFGWRKSVVVDITEHCH
ncbi:uncharacterized protein [Panulirus ornatus]|uniref:uncharacterized protein n=1 Tax=Panulirus ornatus TaxID=150431 RepID=UPI003A838BF4